MVSVVGLAHSPASGVNVYKVVIVLSSAGVQVPVMLLLAVVGKGVKISPLQMSSAGLKTGSTFWFTLIVSVVGFAHSLASGVKV